MAHHQALCPALVLCSPCREQTDFNDRMASLIADEESNSVLVRDVCGAMDCTELQLRGRLCAEHILDYELALQHHIPMRTCHGCRQSVLQLTVLNCDVWFILTPSDEARDTHGAELRSMDKSRSDSQPIEFQSPVRAKGKARLVRTPGMKKKVRRSARTLQQICDRERLRAMEWSLGNVEIKPLFLWKDNKRRIDAEKVARETDTGDTTSTMKTIKPEFPSVVVHSEPLSVFCVVDKCRFYAKTGDRCRFHSTATRPLWNIQKISRDGAPKLSTSVQYPRAQPHE